MTPLVCAIPMLCMSTPTLSNSRAFPRRLFIVQLTWKFSLRTRKVRRILADLMLAPFNPTLSPRCRTGYVRTYLVLPPTIYGKATGKLYDLGVSNPHSIQIPLAIRTGLDRGQGGVVGEGKNIWPHVELNEREFRSFNALWSL